MGSHGRLMSKRFWGFGDLIRGIADSYEICRSRDIDFYIDAKEHSVGKFLNLPAHDFEEYIDESSILFLEGREVIPYLKSSSSEVCVFMTNGRFDRGNIPRIGRSEKTKKYLRQILEPSGELKLLLDNFKYPSEGLKIFHARIGDDELVGERNQSKDHIYREEGDVHDERRYEHILKEYEKELSESNLIISDSMKFKKFASEKTGIRVTDTRACHLGIAPKSIADVANTLLEFFLITKAKRVRSVAFFPNARRPSGFVYWPSIIYGINDVKCYSAIFKNGLIKPGPFSPGWR